MWLRLVIAAGQHLNYQSMAQCNQLHTRHIFKVYHWTIQQFVTTQKEFSVGVQEEEVMIFFMMLMLYVILCAVIYGC